VDDDGVDAIVTPVLAIQHVLPGLVDPILIEQ
jgi:hypothetical protein